MQIQYTDQDIVELCHANPLAAEQLKTIVLVRMCKERDARIAELEGAKPDMDAAE